jgi:hypothetical protein
MQTDSFHRPELRKTQAWVALEDAPFAVTVRAHRAHSDVRRLASVGHVIKAFRFVLFRTSDPCCSARPICVVPHVRFVLFRTSDLCYFSRPIIVVSHVVPCVISASVFFEFDWGFEFVGWRAPPQVLYFTQILFK